MIIIGLPCYKFYAMYALLVDALFRMKVIVLAVLLAWPFPLLLMS